MAYKNVDLKKAAHKALQTRNLDDFKKMLNLLIDKMQANALGPQSMALDGRTMVVDPLVDKQGNVFFAIFADEDEIRNIKMNPNSGIKFASGGNSGVMASYPFLDILGTVANDSALAGVIVCPGTESVAISKPQVIELLQHYQKGVYYKVEKEPWFKSIFK